MRRFARDRNRLEPPDVWERRSGRRVAYIFGSNTVVVGFAVLPMGNVASQTYLPRVPRHAVAARTAHVYLVPPQGGRIEK
jgi:hypothetical protein